MYAFIIIFTSDFFFYPDHSILKCFRIAENKIMVTDQLTGQIKIMIVEPVKKDETKKDKGIYDPFKNAEISKEESAKMFK